MPGTVRLALAATAVALLGLAAPLTQQHDSRPVAGHAMRAVSLVPECANCIQ